MRKALMILEAFTFETPVWGLADLSARIGIPKPTLHHLMTTLLEGGWIAQDPRTKCYRLSMRWWEKGWVAVRQLGLREAARPHIEEVARVTQETVHLAILDTTDPAHVIYIDKIESEHAVRAYSSIGGRAPAYCVATGKAILAFNPDAVLALPASSLRRWTPATLADPVRLARDLAATRRRGYSMNLGEYRSDVHGAAAPIRDHEGQVFAAVGISAPAYRLPRKTIERLAPAVVEASEKIARQLGYLAPPARKRQTRVIGAKP